MSRDTAIEAERELIEGFHQAQRLRAPIRGD